MKFRSAVTLSRDMSQVAENALSRNVEESFKKFPDPEADDFQNLISSSLSKDTSVVNFL